MPHGLLEQSGSERKAQDRKVSVEKNFQDIKILKILDFKIQDFQPPKNDRSSNLFFSMNPLELAISVPGGSATWKIVEIQFFRHVSRFSAPLVRISRTPQSNFRQHHAEHGQHLRKYTSRLRSKVIKETS